MILMSSTAGLFGFPRRSPYAAAKWAIRGLTRTLAQELGPKGIRVNAISAGPIKTLAAAGIKDFKKLQNAMAAITPLRRNISAEEVGNAAAFLCSDLASGITGEIVHVDAGYHAVAGPADSNE
jgi:enoyl-[acyl-carrier protein] reductase I